MPPPRERRKPRGLAVFDTLVAIAALSYVGTRPASVWMPDVGGWRRMVLYAAGVTAVFALLVVWVRWRERREARRLGAPLPLLRPWIAALAVAVAVMIVAGALPQRRINARAARQAAEAAKPRTWPPRTVEGYTFGLTTWYAGDSIQYTLTVRCPADRVCPPSRRMTVTLNAPTAMPWDGVPPRAFVRDGRREYHARRGIDAGDWFPPGEYLQANGWHLYLHPHQPSDTLP